MDINIGKILSWLFGTYFALTGLFRLFAGFVIPSLSWVVSAAPMLILAGMLLPITRRYIEDKIGKKFSTTVLIAATLILALTSNLIASAEGTSPPDIDNRSARQVTEAFVKEWMTPNPDYEWMAQFIAEEWQNELGYSNWRSKMSGTHNLKGFDWPEVTFGGINRTETTAEGKKVFFTIAREDPFKTRYNMYALTLVEENGEWKVRNIDEID